MGVVNRTPDSFFDGGRMDLDAAVDHASVLLEEGADLLDIGAVKAGPGERVESKEEIARLLPLVERLVDRTDAPLSVETGRPEVALAAGAAIVNDVTSLADPGLCEVCAERAAGLILMHNGGQLRGRPRHPVYSDVVKSVGDGLEAARAFVVSKGVRRESLVFDAGLDFGKTTYHSLELVRRTGELAQRHSPLMVAASRKDVVGETLGLPPGDRLEGSLAIAALSVQQGAAILRVHDVLATVRTVRMVEAVLGRGEPVAPLRGLWD
jgi:dihydropteroate synthase